MLKLNSLILIIIFSLFIAGCGKDDAPKTDVKKNENKSEMTTKQTINQEQKDTLKEKKESDMKTDELSKLNVVEMKTSMGTFKFKLYPDKAPVTVARIKELVNSGFYNGIIFHRVIDNFMIQGGDPTGTGTGGSGKKIPDEFTGGLKHNKEGMVAMAHSAAPDSQDSQFYITLAPQPHLDNQYTVFGEIISGMDVVKKIGKVKTGANDKPLTEVKIITATLTEK